MKKLKKYNLLVCLSICACLQSCAHFESRPEIHVDNEGVVIIEPRGSDLRLEYNESSPNFLRVASKSHDNKVLFVTSNGDRLYSFQLINFNDKNYSYSEDDLLQGAILYPGNKPMERVSGARAVTFVIGQKE